MFVCFNSRASHLRVFGIDLLRNTIACLFLEWQLLFDVIFIVIYYSYIIHYKNRSIVTKDVKGTENLQSVFFLSITYKNFQHIRSK